jgi:glycosyltransferase involved in cell wall biosynthesis
MEPKISIIIPTYNRAGLLPQALTSALKQSFSDFEILILDDASTDDTYQRISSFLEDPRVRYIKHPQNIGISANRNYGISIAKGTYIAMLDSDDLWLDESKLSRQSEILDTHPDIGIVGTYVKIIDKEGKETGKISTHAADASIRRSMMFRNQFFQSSILMRKETLVDAGNYDEKIPIWEDYELYLRIGKLHQLRNIPEFLTAYRDHDSNISKESEEKSIRTYRILYKLYKKVYPFAWVLLFKIMVFSVLNAKSRTFVRGIARKVALLKPF